MWPEVRALCRPQDANLSVANREYTTQTSAVEAQMVMFNWPITLPDSRTFEASTIATETGLYATNRTLDPRMLELLSW